MLSTSFLLQFKEQTEARWATQEINPDIYGFQFQQGTRWNKGLTAAEIAEYESAIETRFITLTALKTI